MKKIGSATLSMLFVLAFCQRTEAAIIWSDGFESGDFSVWTSVSGNWDVSGGNVYSGIKRAQIAGPYDPEDDILSLAVSTAGYQNMKLDYRYRIYTGLESNDYVFVEWTANGADWLELASYTNIASSTDWQEASFFLPSSADNNPLFQFRIRSQLNNTSDCIYFDDILLYGDPIPEPVTLALLLCLFPAMVRKKH